MFLRHPLQFIVAIALFANLSFAASVQRSKRQICECTAGEAPKCGCQLLPQGSTRNVQMMCSCSPPVPPKCSCRDNIPMAAPTTPSPTSTGTPYTCVDMCQNSCLSSCAKLLVTTKCSTACSDACKYSCAKQDQKAVSSTNAKTKTTSEYKFIIPNAANNQLEVRSNVQQILTNGSSVEAQSPLSISAHTLTTTTTLPTTTTTVNAHPPLHALPIATTTLAPGTCDSGCMPMCSFSCTALRPALKMLGKLIDSDSSTPSECQKTCGETCFNVCINSGLTTSECSSNCAPACGETCGLIVKVSYCSPSCMPTCSAACTASNPTTTTTTSTAVPVEVQTAGAPQQLVIAPQQIVYVSDKNGTYSIESFVPATQQPVTSTSAPVPSLAPAMMVTNGPTSSVLPQVASLCQNECLVQCENQCGLAVAAIGNTGAGNQCVAACQTTCYPICNARLRKMRRRQKLRQELLQKQEQQA